MTPRFAPPRDSVTADQSLSGIDGEGLVRWMQVRGQAWSLRTLGHAAYIGYGSVSAPVATRNIVVPYMSMRSPSP